MPTTTTTCAGDGTGYWNCDVPGGCADCRSLAREIEDTEQLSVWAEERS